MATNNKNQFVGTNAPISLIPPRDAAHALIHLGKSKLPNGSGYGSYLGIVAEDGWLGNLVDLSARGVVQTTFSGKPAAKSGITGWVINKPNKASAVPHGIDYAVGGVRCWGTGIDYSTNNNLNGGTGNSYFVPVYDYSAGINDAGANGNTGADIFAVSSADACATYGQGPKFAFSYATGSPAAYASFLTMEAGLNLGGLNVSINGTAAHNHISLTQRNTGNNRAGILFAQKWLQTTDIAANGGTDLSWYDNTNLKTRMTLAQSSGLLSGLGLGTTAPQGIIHLVSSQDSSLYDTVQRIVTAGYSTVSNRSVNLEQIIDASSVKNFVWLMGGLGAGSTRATPVATSTFTTSFGLMSDGTNMKVATAASGTNATINFPMSFGQNTAAMFGATPVAQAASTADLIGVIQGFGLMASSGAVPINMNGGALLAGTIATTGISNSGTYGGNGTAWAAKRLVLTFPSDADYTLAPGEKDCLLLDVQAGVISTGRNIIVPGTAGGVYIVINRNANAVTVKTSGSTGIAVAATRAAILCFPGGTTGFRLTPDTVYTS